MTTTTKQSAESAYVCEHYNADQYIQRIQGLLNDMPAPDDEVAINWAHVGSVQEVNRVLRQIVEFLSR